MKSWIQFLVAVSLIIFTVSTFAYETKPSSTYARIVVFGDSLSDVGTYAAVASLKGGGKFTTNPGKIWAEIVADHLGLEMKPNRQEGFGTKLKEIGGFNYAQGGSRVVLARQKSTDEIETLTARPVAEQVGLFLLKNRKFNPDDLVLVQGGANDIFTQLKQVGNREISAEQALERAAQAGEDLAVILANIKNSGAVKVVVMNLPAIEKTPRVLTLDPNAQKLVAGLVAAFNQTLMAKTAGLNVQVIDFYSFDLKFNDEATRLGFKDLTHAACKIDRIPIKSALFCNVKNLVEPEANMKYKFADEMHPTTGFSKQAAEFIFSQVMGK